MSDYVKDGYAIVDIDSWPSLREAHGVVTSEYMAVDGDHTAKQAAAAEAVYRYPRRIVEENLDCLRKIAGLDLHIQRKPFLRISRPGIADDNIGLHRDTWYGDTPYEVSVWIPLTDTDEGNALRVVPGSHIWSEEAHPVERIAGKVEKGSLKHSLGFIHGEPKRLSGTVESIPVPVRVGQMIVFPLSLVHGVEVNRSTRTRVSMDVRLANSLAPIRWQRSRDENYYEPLCVSPATQVAQMYEKANG